MANKYKFDLGPIWKFSEILPAAYKSLSVKKEEDLEYWLICFYTDSNNMGPNSRIMMHPWIILVRGDDIIAKMVVDDKGRGIAFEVNENYRRQGYGERFLRFVIKKYNLNSLQVLTSNRIAIHLYLKLGFKAVKVQTLKGKRYMSMKLEDSEL